MNDARKQTLVEPALVKFVDGIYASDGCDVLEYHLAGTDAHNWAVFLEQTVICLALLETEDMGCDPEIRDRRVPWAGYRTEWGDEELVYRAGDGVEKERCGEEEEGVVGYPRKGEGGESCKVHSDDDSRTGGARDGEKGEQSDFYTHLLGGVTKTYHNNSHGRHRCTAMQKADRLAQSGKRTER